MGKISRKCRACSNISLESLYFRNESEKSRPYIVGLIMCKKCPSGDYNKNFPYWDDITNLYIRIFKDRNKLDMFELSKISEPACLICRKKNILRLHVRRERTRYPFIGYVCKDCKILYLGSFSGHDFKIKPVDHLTYQIKDQEGKISIPPRQSESGIKFPTDEYFGCFHGRMGLGAPVLDEGFHLETWLIPNKKANKITKMLEKAGCKPA